MNLDSTPKRKGWLLAVGGFIAGCLLSFYLVTGCSTPNAVPKHQSDAMVMTNQPSATNVESFLSIFSTDHFIPREVCMARDPKTITLYSLGSFGVFTAYFSIPILLLRFRSSLKTLSPRIIGVPFLLASLFIFFCGGGHLIDIILIKYPFYNLAALWTLGTGTVSWLFFLYTARLLKDFSRQTPTGGKQITEENAS